jgi:hypothetical protein
MLFGNLLYGHKEAIEKFVEAVATGKNIDNNIDCERGKVTVGYMTEIVTAINMKRGKNE